MHLSPAKWIAIFSYALGITASASARPTQAEAAAQRPALPGVILIAGFDTAPGMDARDTWLTIATEETLAWRLRRVPDVVVMPPTRAHQARREIAEGPSEIADWPRVARLMGVRKWLAGTVEGTPDAMTLRLRITDLRDESAKPIEAAFGPGKLFALLNESTAWALEKFDVPKVDSTVQGLILSPPADSPSAVEYFAKAVLAARSDNVRDAMYYAEQALQYDPVYRPAVLLLTQLELRLKPSARAAASVRLKRLGDHVRRLGDRIDECEILMAEGVLDLTVRSFDPAKVRFESALAVARESRDPYGELLALNRLSDLSLAQSVAIDRKTPDAERKRLERDHLEKGVAWQKQTLDLLQNLGDTLGEAPSAVKLALLFEKLEDYDKALLAHQQTLKAARAAGSKRAETTAQMLIGQCYRKLKRIPEAIDSLNQCLNLAGKAERPMARIALAELLQDSAVNRPDDAAQQLEQACAELEDGSLDSLLKALRSLAEVRLRLNQRDKALAALGQARDVANALRSPEESSITKQIEAIRAGKTP